MQRWFLVWLLKLSILAFVCAGPPLQCGPPSSFGEWGLPTVLGFERLISVASFVPEHGLLSAGASEIVVQTLGRSTGCGVFPNKDQTGVPWTTAQILNHRPTREAPNFLDFRILAGISYV